MHYLLLGVVSDTGRTNGETDGVELTEPVWDGSKDDTVDVGMKLRRSGSNSGHTGLG